MMNNSTIEALKAMRFSAMAAEFERQLDDPAAYSHLGFEERFALMVDAEWNRRQQNRLARCIREAHFATPAAMIEDIEYHEDRRPRSDYRYIIFRLIFTHFEQHSFALLSAFTVIIYHNFPARSRKTAQKNPLYRLTGKEGAFMQLLLHCCT